MCLTVRLTFLHILCVLHSYPVCCVGPSFTLCHFLIAFHMVFSSNSLFQFLFVSVNTSMSTFCFVVKLWRVSVFFCSLYCSVVQNPIPTVLCRRTLIIPSLLCVIWSPKISDWLFWPYFCQSVHFASVPHNIDDTLDIVLPVFANSGTSGSNSFLHLTGITLASELSLGQACGVKNCFALCYLLVDVIRDCF